MKPYVENIIECLIHDCYYQRQLIKNEIESFVLKTNRFYIFVDFILHVFF